MSDAEAGPAGRRQGRRAPDQSPATALAIGKASDDDAAAYLREQLRLTRLQADHFEVEHRHVIDGTRASRALEAMKIVIQGALTLLLIAAAALFANMVWTASRDHSLVIERFAVPPDLANGQISGEQLAALVADKLATLNASASSFRAENTFDVDWGKDINIEVPGAGVSLAEIDRLLRQRLGHQTRIGGTLFHEGKDLRLSLRTGLGPSASVDGSLADIDQLAQRAAEALSFATQPYRYSKYLEFNGRAAEALAVAQKTASSSAPPEERGWAWAQISNLLSAKNIPACRIAGYRAIDLDPGNALAFLNTANCEFFLGHDQVGSDLQVKSVKLATNGGGGLSKVGLETGAVLNRGWVAFNAADYNEAAKVFSRKVGTLYGNLGDTRPTNLALIRVLLHDISGSRQVHGAEGDLVVAAHFYTGNVYVAPDYARAAEVGDWATALRSVDAVLALLKTEPEGPEIAHYAAERFYLSNRARALVELGRGAEARTLVEAAARDCYYCLRTRAWVMGRTGDLASANRDFAAAFAAAPRLPFADLEWGSCY